MDKEYFLEELVDGVFKLVESSDDFGYIQDTLSTLVKTSEDIPRYRVVEAWVDKSSIWW
ncbi:hypothetical protein phi9181_ORF043 [Enterococcus phage 9181]|nr:hypothetical protein phi9181_ORF043 [Enterococcus phage 9181]